MLNNKLKTTQMNLLDILIIPKGDAVAFTFFTGYMAMLAASIFFFFERGYKSEILLLLYQNPSLTPCSYLRESEK